MIALKDNIAKKGKNAYYYAHGHGANGPGNTKFFFLAFLCDFCAGIWNVYFVIVLISSVSITSSFLGAQHSSLCTLAWDGKEEPRLLSSEKSDGSTKEKACKEFASYAWADEKKSVKIYIDYEGADQIDDSDISIQNTTTSLEFTVSILGNPYSCWNVRILLMSSLDRWLQLFTIFTQMLTTN